MRVNLREHLNLFLGNKGNTPTLSREQGNMYPPPPWEALLLEPATLCICCFGCPITASEISVAGLRAHGVLFSCLRYLKSLTFSVEGYISL